jgi:hypothetical protein
MQLSRPLSSNDQRTVSEASRYCGPFSLHASAKVDRTPSKIKLRNTLAEHLMFPFPILATANIYFLPGYFSKHSTRVHARFTIDVKNIDPVAYQSAHLSVFTQVINYRYSVARRELSAKSVAS